MAEQGQGGLLQSLYENMYLLLVIGVLLPTVIYTVWGLAEMMNLPQLDVDKYMQELKPAPSAQVESQPAPAPEAAPAQPEEAKP